MLLVFLVLDPAGLVMSMFSVSWIQVRIFRFFCHFHFFYELLQWLSLFTCCMIHGPLFSLMILFMLRSGGGSSHLVASVGLAVRMCARVLKDAY